MSFDSTQDMSERLKEVALLFLKIGSTAFGGPAAYIAIMHREVVRRRAWMDDQRFLDLVGATNIIPGPNATEIAIHLGLVRAGWSGFVAAGAVFILPGMLATLLFAWAYVRFGALPQTGWILYGIKPIVIAIVVQALWDLGRRGIKGPLTAIVGAVIVPLYLLRFNEIALLFAGAAVVLLVAGWRRFWRGNGASLLAILPLLKVPSLAVTVGSLPFSQAGLFFSFLKIGSVLYGSGYVLLAFLNSEFVERLGWLTRQQVLDAVAAGQATPGPVFSSATFAGYLMGGWQSALLATFAIFLPSFVFVAFLSRFLPVLRKTWWTGAFLDGVNVSALGLMAGVSWQLGRAALIDWFTVGLTAAALLVVFRLRVNSAWLIVGGGMAGAVYKMATG